MFVKVYLLLRLRFNVHNYSQSGCMIGNGITSNIFKIISTVFSSVSICIIYRYFDFRWFSWWLFIFNSRLFDCSFPRKICPKLISFSLIFSKFIYFLFLLICFGLLFNKSFLWYINIIIKLFNNFFLIIWVLFILDYLFFFIFLLYNLFLFFLLFNSWFFSFWWSNYIPQNRGSIISSSGEKIFLILTKFNPCHMRWVPEIFSTLLLWSYHWIFVKSNNLIISSCHNQTLGIISTNRIYARVLNLSEYSLNHPSKFIWPTCPLFIFHWTSFDISIISFGTSISKFKLVSLGNCNNYWRCQIPI